MAQHITDNTTQVYAWWLERACIYAGLFMVLLLGLGLWSCAGFIPPPTPLDSAADIAARFAQHQNGILLGSLLVMVGSGGFMLFCTALSSAMRRHNPALGLLAHIQLACAAINVLLFTQVGLFWMTAAFRVDADPNLVRMFNDMAWLIMVVPTVPFMLQLVAAGAVALASPAGTAALPRWSGYFNLWCALLALPGMFSGFFKTGPIAWNGILSFWLEGAVFCLWLLVMCPVLLKALPRPAPAQTPAQTA